MNQFSLPLFALLAVAAAGQEPAAKGVRLVYEMPVDAMQRTLRDRPDQNLEQLLAESAANVQLRVPAGVNVTRSGATQFTVDLPDAAPEELDRVRASIETTGKFEMRIVAHDFDLTEERARLHKWLDDGGHARLQKDPRAIADFESGNDSVRWFARRIGPNGKQPGKWGPRMQDFGLGDVCVAGYTDADWNDGVIPAVIRALPLQRQCLVELVAVDMAETFFANADLDAAGTKVVNNLRGGSAVRYRIVAERAAEYSDWTEKHLRQCCAMLWDDEVLSLPRFVTRIPGGHGQISGGTDRRAEVMAAAMRAPLVIKPQLIRIEPR